MRPLALLCLLLLLSLPARPALAQAAPFNFLRHKQKRTSAPLQVQRNLLILSVRLNGAGPYNFLLDTGVPTTIITDPALADSLRLRHGQQFRVVGAGGEATGLLAYESTVSQLTIKGVVADSLTVLVLSEDVLNLGGYVGLPVHGILGSELFRSFVVSVQPEQRRVLLHRPDAFRPPRGRRWASVPLRIEQQKAYLTLPVQLREGPELPLKLVLDTGAGHALSLETNSDPRLTLPPQRLAAQLGRGLTGVVEGHLGRVARLRLGRYALAEVLTSFPNAADVGRRADVPRNGNLGYELLKRFVLVIDYPHGRLWLRPGTEYGQPFEHDMSGLDLVATGANFRRYFVTHVEPQSPASESDLAVNDELLTINFMPSYSYSLTQLSRLLHSGDGRTLHLLVRRADGELYTTLLRLRRQI